MSKPLYVLDLDNTLIHGDCSTIWGHYLVSKGWASSPDYLAREQSLMEDYAKGKMNIHEYVAWIQSPLANMTVAETDNLVAEFVETEILPRVYPQAKTLIQQLQAQDHPLLVISASVSLLVAAITSALGINQSIGIDVKIENDHYTGIIDGTPSYQQGKVTRLADWLTEHKDCTGELTFYTDSINDLPLCLQAKHVFLVNPCEQLTRYRNQQHSWAILNWHLES